MALTAARVTPPIDLAVFARTGLVGHRRFDRVRDGVDFAEDVQDEGFRVLPLSPAARAAWTARHVDRPDAGRSRPTWHDPAVTGPSDLLLPHRRPCGPDRRTQTAAARHTGPNQAVD